MKRSFFAAFILLLLTAGASPANAQFTLLPDTAGCKQNEKPSDCAERVDALCADLLNKYELSGEVPTAKDVAVKEADIQLQKSTNDYNSLPDLCKGGGYGTSDACKDFSKVNAEKEQAEKNVEAAKSVGDAPKRDLLLGCAIKTGRISLQMIPYFITYLANFLLAMSGIVSVLFIVIGGYFYIYGGLVDQKERGKKYLVNALVGLSLATVSWSLVTFIINAITS
ncbi:MAG: pilin [Candidatus Gracilibacteria bacterium]|nr:hypothetical protein [Candidatus Peregrinibacteria bacterium]